MYGFFSVILLVVQAQARQFQAETAVDGGFQGVTDISGKISSKIEFVENS